MPLERYPQDNLQPESDDSIVWRYLPLNRFEDLITTGELYFTRADRFSDQNEGLPTENYVKAACENMGPGHDVDYMIGELVQGKESYFISCWTRSDCETAYHWSKYAPQGVAIRTRYGLLKRALDAFPNDRTMLGLIRYSVGHVGFNVLRFITTKRPEFARDREVRALIWVPEWAGLDRHVDINNKIHRSPLTPPPAHVPQGLRRKVDLQHLIEEIIVSPNAGPGIDERVRGLIKDSGLSVAVKVSSFGGHSHLSLDLDEIVKWTTNLEA